MTKSPCVGPILCCSCLQHRLSMTSFPHLKRHPLTQREDRDVPWSSFAFSLLCSFWSQYVAHRAPVWKLQYQKLFSIGVMFPGTGLLEGRTAWGKCLRLCGFPKLRGIRVYLPCHQNINHGWTEKF